MCSSHSYCKPRKQSACQLLPSCLYPVGCHAVCSSYTLRTTPRIAAFIPSLSPAGSLSALLLRSLAVSFSLLCRCLLHPQRFSKLFRVCIAVAGAVAAACDDAHRNQYPECQQTNTRTNCSGQ